MNRIDIENFLSRLSGIKALVIGDLMLDEYLWGKAERISPEAPVQVVEITREDLRLGGAGNVVNNLTALGCGVLVASVLGEDEDSRRLQRMLNRQGVDTAGLLCDQQRTTSRKTRILASNQQMLRFDRESREPIGAELEARLVDRVRQVIAEVQVILVSDYLKGVLTPGLLAAVIAAGRSAGVPVVIDPKGDDYGKYRGATVLTPNRREAQSAAGIAIVDEDSLLRAGRKLVQRTGAGGAGADPQRGRHDPVFPRWAGGTSADQGA